MIEITKNTQGSNDDACCGDFNSIFAGRNFTGTINVPASVKNFRVDYTAVQSVVSKQVNGNEIGGRDNLILETIDLSKLTNTWALSLFNHPLLIALNVNSLEQARTIDIEDAFALPTLSFPRLKTLLSPSIRNNPMLTSLAFASLESVYSITVFSNKALTNVLLPNLKQAEYIELVGNNLSDIVIDNLFIQLNANGLTDCQINVSGQRGGGTATVASLVDRLNLITNGCTITL